jgi:hypothetical protein
MTKEKPKSVPNLKGKFRPEMLSDRLGYPASVGDEDWKNHKRFWRRLPNGEWVRKY